MIDNHGIKFKIVIILKMIIIHATKIVIIVKMIYIIAIKIIIIVKMMFNKIWTHQIILK